MNITSMLYELFYEAIYTMIRCLIHSLYKIFILVILLLFVSYHTYASVVVTSNRIIYPASATERTVEFFNNDSAPYMIQIWTDIDNPNSTTQTADGPFLANPPLFKISPNTNQMVRLKFVGKNDLPKDRESVFYFNFLQIPSLKQANAEKNKLALLITTRLKIFYRPEGLISSPENIADNLTFSHKNKTIEVSNSSAYHASFINVNIVDAKGNIIMKVPKTPMVAPKSSKSWAIPQSINQNNLFINYSLINDYGATEKHQGKLN